MPKVRAAICHAFGEPLQIEEVELRLPRGREVEVTLGAVAICHSDIAFASGAWGGALPAVFGHEAAGDITALGPDVQGLKVGDRVVVTLIRACGSCPTCSGGRPVICETPGTSESPIRTEDGYPIVQAMNTGAFAERVVVDQSQIVRVPEDLAIDAASLLACGVITGVGAVVNAAKLQPGEDVVVIGAGGVGLNAIQGAHIAGARSIVAVDLTEDKLNDARDFGATHGLIAGAEPPDQAIRSAIGRGAGAVIVTVGAIPAFNDAPHFLAPGGRVVLVGMPSAGAMAGYEPVALAAASQSLIGSKMGDAVIDRDIPWLVGLHQRGQLQLETLISGRWAFDQINEAIDDTTLGKARRNVIVF